MVESKKSIHAVMQMLQKSGNIGGSNPSPSAKNNRTGGKECGSMRQLGKDRAKGRRMTTDEAGKQMQRLKVTTKNRTNKRNQRWQMRS